MVVVHHHGAVMKTDGSYGYDNAYVVDYTDRPWKFCKNFKEFGFGVTSV